MGTCTKEDAVTIWKTQGGPRPVTVHEFLSTKTNFTEEEIAIFYKCLTCGYTRQYGLETLKTLRGAR
jgi:hypothetical protein